MCIDSVSNKTDYSPIESNDLSDSGPNDAVKLASYFTQAKIKRIFLYVFATLAAAAGCTLAAWGAANIFSGPCAFASIPLFIGAAGCLGLSAWLFYRARDSKDYENPTELREMREQATHLSFPQLVKLHGLELIQQYKIVTPEELQEKFQNEFINIPLSKIVNQYPLETMEQYDLYEDGFLQKKFHEEFQNQSFSEITRQFSLGTIDKYNLAKDGFLQKKFVEEIGENVKALEKRASLSEHQIQEHCFQDILATQSLETIQAYRLLPSSKLDILKEFLATKDKFNNEQSQLGQKYDTRIGKRLAELKYRRDEAIAKAKTQAAELARTAANQAKTEADRINHQAQAKYKQACAERERNILHYLKQHPRRELTAALLFPQPSLPPPVYPSPTKSAEEYYASETAPKEALAAFKENKHLIVQNNIETADQSAYDNQMQAAKDSYEARVGHLYDQFVDKTYTQ